MNTPTERIRTLPDEATRPRPLRELPPLVHNALETASSELYAVQSLAWAAEMLLLHNPDNTITAAELAGRVSCLARAINTKAEELGTVIDSAEVSCLQWKHGTATPGLEGDR